MGSRRARGDATDMNRPEYEVFLSCNGKDEAAVWELVRRMRDESGPDGWSDDG